MKSVLVIVSKAVFKKVRVDGKAPELGDVLATQRYESRHKGIDALDDGALFLVTARPDDALWLVGVLERPKPDDEGWEGPANEVAITDVTACIPKFVFASGKGLSPKPGRLGMSLQSPRTLTAADEAMLRAALARKKRAKKKPAKKKTKPAKKKTKPAKKKGGAADFFDRAYAAWEETRDPWFVPMLSRLGRSLEGAEFAALRVMKRVDNETWLDGFDRASMHDRGALLDTFAKGRIKETRARVKRLNEWLPDPRVVDLALWWAETLPFSSTSSQSVVNQLLKLAEASGDPQVPDRLAAIDADEYPCGDAMKDWMRERLAKARGTIKAEHVAMTDLAQVFADEFEDAMGGSMVGVSATRPPATSPIHAITLASERPLGELDRRLGPSYTFVATAGERVTFSTQSHYQSGKRTTCYLTVWEEEKLIFAQEWSGNAHRIDGLAAMSDDGRRVAWAVTNWIDRHGEFLVFDIDDDECVFAEEFDLELRDGLVVRRTQPWEQHGFRAEGARRRWSADDINPFTPAVDRIVATNSFVATSGLWGRVQQPVCDHDLVNADFKLHQTGGAYAAHVGALRGDRIAVSSGAIINISAPGHDAPVATLEGRFCHQGPPGGPDVITISKHGKISGYDETFASVTSAYVRRVVNASAVHPREPIVALATDESIDFVTLFGRDRYRADVLGCEYLTFHPDGALLAITKRSLVRIEPSSAATRTLREDVTSVAVHKGGAIATGHTDGTVRLGQGDDAEVVAKHILAPRALAFSDDALFVGTARLRGKGTLVKYDVKHRARRPHLRQLTAEDEAMLRAAFAGKRKPAKNKPAKKTKPAKKKPKTAKNKPAKKKPVTTAKMSRGNTATASTQTTTRSASNSGGDGGGEGQDAHAKAANLFDRAYAEWERTLDPGFIPILRTLGKRLESDEFAALRDQKRVDPAEWLALFSRATIYDRGALLDTFWRGRLADIRGRIGQLKKWLPDPRVIDLCLRWAESLPFGSTGSQDLWNGMMKLVEEQNDPQAAARLDAIHVDGFSCGETMKGWLTKRIPQARAEITSEPKSRVAAAVFADELEELLAIGQAAPLFAPTPFRARPIKQLKVEDEFPIGEDNGRRGYASDRAESGGRLALLYAPTKRDRAPGVLFLTLWENGALTWSAESRLGTDQNAIIALREDGRVTGWLKQKWPPVLDGNTTGLEVYDIDQDKLIFSQEIDTPVQPYLAWLNHHRMAITGDALTFPPTRVDGEPGPQLTIPKVKKRRVPKHKDPAPSAYFSPSIEMLAVTTSTVTAGQAHTDHVHLSRRDRAGSVDPLGKWASFVSGVHPLTDDRVAVSNGKSLRVYAANEKNSVGKLYGTSAHVSAGSIVTLTTKGRVTLYDENLNETKSFALDRAIKVSAAHAVHTILAVSDGHEVDLVSLEGQPISTIPLPKCTHLAFHPDGSLLAIADGTLTRIDLKEGIVAALPRDNTVSLAVHSGGSVATGHLDGAVRVGPLTDASPFESQHILPPRALGFGEDVLYVGTALPGGSGTLVKYELTF